MTAEHTHTKALYIPTVGALQLEQIRLSHVTTDHVVDVMGRVKRYKRIKSFDPFYNGPRKPDHRK